MQREALATETAAAEAPAAAAPAAAGSLPAQVLMLQRTAGNHAVRRLLARAESKTDSGRGPGDWTEDDRRRKTERWKQACEYNLLRGADSEYTEVVHRRDFYWWFYDAIVAKGGETRWPNVPWVDVDYKQVKPMITACASTRNTVNGAFWRKVFIDICDDDNITGAVDDLGLAEPERSEWIKEEKAIF